MPATISVPKAGAFAWGFNRATSYALNARGEFPCEVVKIGERFHVRTADLARALGIDPAALLEG